MFKKKDIEYKEWETLRKEKIKMRTDDDDSLDCLIGKTESSNNKSLFIYKIIMLLSLLFFNKFLREHICHFI